MGAAMAISFAEVDEREAQNGEAIFVLTSAFRVPLQQNIDKQ
jgi:hypothetical protein